MRLIIFGVCHRYAVIVWLCVGTCAGCGDRQGPSKTSESQLSRTEGTKLSTTTEPKGLSDEETERILGIVDSASGIVIRNSQGNVTGIDVARQRTPIDEEAAKSILKLPRLNVLRLAINSISTSTVDQLAAQSELHELLLRDAPISDPQLARVLKNLPTLERLTLRRLSGVTDKTLVAVAALDKLKVLALVDMQITGDGLQKLTQLECLRSVDLRDCNSLKTSDYRALLDMNSLTELKLGGSTIDDATVDLVIELPSLNSLTIEDAPVSATAIKRLATRPQLAKRIRSLVLTRCYGVTDEALSVLANLPNLETLSVRACPVSDKFLTSLAETSANKLPPLVTLVVTGAFLSEDAIAVLPRFAKSLRRLDISGVALSGSSTNSIGKLTQLQTLRLSDCSLDDAGVKPIQALRNLVTLDLSNNNEITGNVTEVLETLPRLKHVDTENTSP